jgi:hypothetical protein
VFKPKSLTQLIRKQHFQGLAWVFFIALFIFELRYQQEKYTHRVFINLIDSSKSAIAKNGQQWKNETPEKEINAFTRSAFAVDHEHTIYDKLFIKTSNLSQDIERGIDVVEVDLNECDSAQLEKLPRIGPYTARKIIQYRSRLGGYISVLQLREIKGLDTLILNESQIKWKVNLSKINKLNFGQFDVVKWYKHPYIGKEKAKIIQNYVKLHSPMTESKWLKMKALSESEKTIIHPYLHFE